MIRILPLTSDLHREMSDPDRDPFLLSVRSSLKEDIEITDDPSGSPLVYIRTGGTENQFRTLGIEGNVRILTSGSSNSLAASMEILAFLRRKGQSGEILHGSPEEIAGKIRGGCPQAPGQGSCPAEEQAHETEDRFVKGMPGIDLKGIRLGVIGRPSDWLIASDVDYRAVREKLNAHLVDIPLQELIDAVPASCTVFEGSEAIGTGLRTIIDRYHLGGLTLRCFDLLGTLHNTGCLALARLNAEGIPCSCEGDIPALLTMAWLLQERGCPGFQANLSRIEDGNRLLFAHCTVPLDMTLSHRYTTHFESGIGTAIKGELPLREVMICKISPELDKMACIPGRIVENRAEPKLCRTQIIVESEGAADYFLKYPLANHHVIGF